MIKCPGLSIFQRHQYKHDTGLSGFQGAGLEGIPLYSYLPSLVGRHYYEEDSTQD